MLDLAKGDLVRLRNGEIGRVKHVDGRAITVSILALNGFGHTLWEEAPYEVEADTGHVGKVPHAKDVRARVRRKEGWWSDKFIDEPLTQF